MEKYDIKPIRFFPLQKIEVIESKKAYKPGSLGYVVFTHSVSSMVRPLMVIFMRFGKKGRTRVTADTLYYQSLDLTTLDKESLSLITTDKSLWYYKITASVVPAIQETKNLENIPGREFVCYIAAFSHYLCYLSNLVDKPAPWRGHLFQYLYGAGDVLKFVDTLDQIGKGIAATTLCNIITSASTIGKVEDHVLLKDIITFYDVPGNRRICMEALHKELSSYKKAIERYYINSLASDRNAVAMIKDVLQRRGEIKDRGMKLEKAKPRTR